MGTLSRIFLALAILAASALAQAKVDLFAQAGAAYDSGQFEKAARLYREAGRKGLQPAIAWFNYGNCQARLGKRGEAAAAWKKSLEWAPRFKRARLNLAILSEEDGQVGMAVAEYRRLWELDSKDASVALRLGELQLSQNDAVGGVEWFEKAIQLDSASTTGYEGLVRAHLMARDTVGAWLALERWMEFAVDSSARIWFARSQLWEQAGDLEQARIQCETGLAHSPANVDGWLRLARIHQLGRADATALAVLRTATDRNPREGRLWKALGQAALRAGDGETAYQGLANAVELGERGTEDLLRILSSWHDSRGETDLADRARELRRSVKK
ncbi:MAG TPA: tetratricopeptide repeat protein [Fibrobacteria bacterium]|nr:tetratricopeptide repeat protein [Fibrobacteria bacterium]